MIFKDLSLPAKLERIATMEVLRKNAEYITKNAIKAVLPDEAVKRALKGRNFEDRVILVAIGKAAYQMAKTAREILGDRMDRGIVITKYDHVKGPIEGCECWEAGCRMRTAFVLQKRRLSWSAA